MRRRDFITLLGGAAAVAWPLALQAQQGDRVRRIGVLQALGESDPEAQLRKMAFVGGLQKFGWTEGTNVMIDYRWAGGNITGFTLGEFSMGGKILEVLKEVAPRVNRVAVILNLEQPPHVAMWRSIEATEPLFG